MQNRLTRQYFIIVIILSVAIALTLRFPLIMNMMFGDTDDHHVNTFKISFLRFFVELLITFLVALVMFSMNYFILKPTGKLRLKAINVVLAIILTVALVTILNHILFSLISFIESQPQGRGRRNEFDLINFYVSALVVGCVMIIRLVFQRQSIMVENEALKREALQSQYESLKNQLSPHFLFNSLTALKVLIQEAPGKAQDYVNSLSKALRYTLQSNEKQLVTLKEEMEFMDSYLFLIRMRFDSNLSVNTVISESLFSYRLPPLTIQTLVENAIKHNEISKRKPLNIEIITTEKESLCVANNIQKKMTEVEGTGIGLTNLSTQFQLLAGKDILISNDDGRFIVEIPLIKQ